MEPHETPTPDSGTTLKNQRKLTDTDPTTESVLNISTKSRTIYSTLDEALPQCGRRFHAMLIAALLVFVFTAAAATMLSQRLASNKDLYCRARSCYQYSALIHESINTTVNPCENFYRFVCTGWNKRHPFPVREAIFRNYRRSIMDSASSMKVRGNHNTPMQKAAKFYQSCVDVLNAPVAPSTKGLTRTLKSVGVHWPRLVEDVDVLDTLVKLHINWRWEAVMKIEVVKPRDDARPKPGLSHQHKVILSSSDFLAEILDRREIMIERGTYRAYYKTLHDAFAVPGEDTIDFEAFGVVENGLVPILKSVQGRDRRSSLWLDEPHESPIIPVEYLEKLRDVLKKRCNIPLYQSVKVYVEDWKFVRAFFILLQQFGEETTFAYLGWTVAQRLALISIPDVVTLFYGGHRNAQMQHPSFCFDFVENLMGFALDAVVTSLKLTPTVLKDITTLSSSIEALHDTSLTQYFFRNLNLTSKVQPQHKLDAALQHLAKFLPESLQVSYKNYSEMKDSALGNWRAASEGYRHSNPEDVVTHRFATDTQVHYHAFDRREGNFLLMPWALQHPFYEVDYPSSIKYGNVGAQLTTILSERFFRTGVIWDERSRALVLRYIRCFLPGLSTLSNVTNEIASQVHSIFTLGVLWNAYRPSATLGKRLPMGRFTQDELFFLSWCYTHCSAPGASEGICNVPLRNFKPFADTFKCGKANGMTSDTDCGMST
ncbi:neprilysin-2-like [Ornithodoros turicata]|uniref:neprilysin-2-like n=1 Tax=Ornithodoros turicata TaxID=34597 RepID=UPI00313932C8